MYSDYNARTVRQLILDEFSRNAYATIPSVASSAGLSITSVSNYFSRLVQDGFLEKTGEEETSGKGRRAVKYEIKSSAARYIGVDVKNFELVIGLVDTRGEVLRKVCDKNYRFANTSENAVLILESIERFIASLENLSKKDISAVCFCLGGRVDSKEGTSASLFNFEETRDMPLADYLGERLGMNVFIENDSKAMAYGDYLAYGKAWDNVLVANVSWGFGLGIIIDRKMFYGRQGYSGEIGHMHAYDNNILCYCGRKGCIETEVSGQAVIRKIRTRLRAGEASVYPNCDEISLDDVVKASVKEDSLTIEIVSDTGRELGKHLAGMMNLFNPNCIIIGGKLAEIPQFYFLQQAVLATRQHSLRLLSKDVVVLPSKLKDDAGIIGVCLLVRDRDFLQEGQPATP